MNINWDELNEFGDWVRTLQIILQEAVRSLQSSDIPARVAAQNALSRFIQESPNAIAGELDAIARKTIDDIFLQTTDEALNSIAARSADLSLHAKTVAAITDKAEQDAKSISLRAATKVITSTTQIIQDLGALRSAVRDDAEAADIAAKIDRAVKALNELVPLVMAVK